MAFTHPVSIVSRSHSMAEHALSPHQRSFSYPLEDLRSAQTRFALRQLYDLPKSWPAALVSRWVHECTLEHALCRNEGRKPIAGLWLIDCNTLQIVPAPAEPSYVALSYVWGKFRKTPQDTPHGSLPSPLPLLISDAIEVCRQLGFQYLWVDKYCIDQNNPQVKHNQIQQMDLVYRNGQLTIIAAAGKDETYGLPGVSSCPRRTLPTRQKRPRALSTSEDPACGIKCYCDGNLSTTSTILDVQRAVLRSKWSTRGWTYQEGSLSRRCLAFTDEQVYFECDSGICYCEAPGTVETSSEAAIGIFRTLVPDPRNSFDRQYLALLGAIEEYSKRELTYDSDILYAFAGIMRRYQSLSPSIKQIAGLPFIVQDAQGGVCEINIGDSDDIEVDLEMDGSSPPPPVHDLDWDLKQQLKDTSFPYGLAWAHKHSCWEEDHVKPRRRGQLPSWAWPEWAGEVTFCWWGTIRLNDFQPFIEDIKVELRDGKVMPYQDLPSPAAGCHQQDGQTLAPQALLFKSIPIPPRLVDVKWANRERVEWSVCGFRTSLSLSAGADSPFRFRKDLVKRGLFELVILGGDGDWKPPSREHSLLLVLGRHDEDWVRCGVMRVDCSLRELLDALVEHDVFPYYERKKVYRVE